MTTYAESHPYEPCDHVGRHGYTLSGEAEYEMCERCRRGPEAHAPMAVGRATIEQAGGGWSVYDPAVGDHVLTGIVTHGQARYSAREWLASPDADHYAGRHPIGALPFYGCAHCADEVRDGARPDPDNTTGGAPMRTSTVNLTLTIETGGGVPEGVTAQTLADVAQRAVAVFLSNERAGAGTRVTGKVSSAFIVRTEVSE